MASDERFAPERLTKVEGTGKDKDKERGPVMQTFVFPTGQPVVSRASLLGPGSRIMISHLCLPPTDDLLLVSENLTVSALSFLSLLFDCWRLTLAAVASIGKPTGPLGAGDHHAAVVGQRALGQAAADRRGGSTRASPSRPCNASLTLACHFRSPSSSQADHYAAMQRLNTLTCKFAKWRSQGFSEQVRASLRDGVVAVTAWLASSLSLNAGADGRPARRGALVR